VEPHVTLLDRPRWILLVPLVQELRLVPTLRTIALPSRHALVLPMVEQPIVFKSMLQLQLRTAPVQHAIPASLLRLVTIRIVLLGQQK